MIGFCPSQCDHIDKQGSLLSTWFVVRTRSKLTFWKQKNTAVIVNTCNNWEGISLIFSHCVTKDKVSGQTLVTLTLSVVKQLLM